MSVPVQISAAGFRTTSTSVQVQVGNAASANARLQVGRQDQVVEVTGSAVEVNTEQPTVQGVLASQDIENLPTGSRNFLDLAQLEPGVQIQDGGNFDPTKNGFSMSLKDFPPTAVYGLRSALTGACISADRERSFEPLSTEAVLKFSKRKFGIVKAATSTFG